MSEKKTTSKKVHTLTLEDQTKLAQANVKKMEQGKIEVMKVVEGVQGAEKLAELIERGKKNGKLSSSELMDVLENLDLESDQMDKIYDTLENLGIDTVGDDYLPELADDIMPPLEELNEIEELPEEETPLAEVPETGDMSALWLAMTALSGTGLAGVTFLGRKKRDEE